MGSKGASETFNKFYFDYLTLRLVDWVSWRFSSSSMRKLIQIFQMLIWKKIKSLLNYKLRQNIRKEVEKSSKIGQYKKSFVSTFQCFLTAIAKI